MCATLRGKHPEEAQAASHTRRMDTPGLTCFNDPEHAKSIRYQVACTIHDGEITDFGACRICWVELVYGTLIDPIPFEQKSPPGPDPATIAFGAMIGSIIGDLVSVASSAIAYRHSEASGR